ncbi:MAG: Hint domain-containing protein [Paracoccus sp. (in: a-proteobacteria)]|uniref:Hint domain-containing protein n=1 Tax=Paracoccus sp. TaxID=267 RepID=UPI0039E3A985
MAVTTIRVIYLGSHRDLDPNENARGAERADELVGATFGSSSAPLARDIHEMLLNDGNDDQSVAFNTSHGDTHGEYVTVGDNRYDLDAGIIYRGTVTYTDGTSVTDVPLRILQDTAGHLVLVPPPRSAQAAEVQGVTAKAIQSITLTAVTNSRFNGLDTSRYGLADPPVFVCFRSGTMIATDKGERPVEDLRAGDLVLTHDHGPQPIRWIGCKSLGGALLGLFPTLRPVRIRAGALGSGLPRRDLYLSQQHRVLVRSRIAESLLGGPEVLVAAKHLTGLPGIEIDQENVDLRYFHMLFDRHEIVLSEGAQTESLFTGPEAMKALPPETRAEVMALFPKLLTTDQGPVPARPIGQGRAARDLARRHGIKRRALQPLSLG